MGKASKSELIMGLLYKFHGMPYQYSILCKSPLVKMNENTEIGEASNIAGTPPSPTEVSFFEPSRKTARRQVFLQWVRTGKRVKISSDIISDRSK